MKLILTKSIRDIIDFPKKGIVFKDITPLLKDKKYLKLMIDTFYNYYKSKKIDKVVSMESRGFIIGSALAYKLGAGFVPIRKKGKLPYKTISVTYDLEYGKDTLEIHEDSINPGERVLIVDDVLATGGTAKAVTQLINKLSGKIIGIGFLIELSFLKGRNKLSNYNLYSIITY